MELTASNIATCTIATTRCAAGGVMRGVTKAMAFSFQSAITSANAEGAGVISATATSTLRRLACMPCPLLFVERWRPRMTAATARTVASARRSSRFDLLRRHANAAASGVMSGTHATRRCAYLVPDLYRPPERARINCLCRGLRVAIGKGYKRKVPSNGSDARLVRTVTRGDIKYCDESGLARSGQASGTGGRFRMPAFLCQRCQSPEFGLVRRPRAAIVSTLSEAKRRWR